MFGVTCRDRKLATWIKEQKTVEDVLLTIKDKCTWTGHIMRVGMTADGQKSYRGATEKL